MNDLQAWEVRRPNRIGEMIYFDTIFIKRTLTKQQVLDSLRRDGLKASYTIQKCMNYNS
jgi:hypothetical protein